jgi:hypothetical protein
VSLTLRIKNRKEVRRAANQGAVSLEAKLLIRHVAYVARSVVGGINGKEVSWQRCWDAFFLLCIK